MKRPTRPLDTVHRIEALEARALFSAYLHHSLEDSFNLPAVLRQFDLADLESRGFGAVVAGTGDIDADGVPDLAIAEVGAPPSFLPPIGGRVFLFSGRTGDLIRTLTDSAPEFGVAMVNLGDVNDDGVPDLLIGSPGYDGTDNSEYDPEGRAYIYSGADGEILRTFEGTTPDGDFGRALARLNDANGDEVQDVIIGAPGRVPVIVAFPGDLGFRPDTPGEVFIFSGVDGSLIRTHTGENAGDRFGYAIATAPQTGTNQSLFAVGSPWFNNEATGDYAGRVYVFSVEGSQAYTLDGESAGDLFGTAVAIVPVTIDTSLPPGSDRKLVVGAPGADFTINTTETPVSNQGHLESFDLANGMFRIVGGASDPTEHARLGEKLALISDLNFDGAADFAAIAPGTGDVYTYDGFLGSFRNFGSIVADPALTDLYHLSIGLIGDVNDDGIPDIASGTVSALGEVRVQIISTLGFGQPIRIDGTSPDLRYMWSQSTQDAIVFTNGVPRALRTLPGFLVPEGGDTASTRSYIQAIGNDGAIYFFNQSASDPHSELMVWRDGTVVTLQSLVTMVEGNTPSDYDTLRIVKIGSGGHLLLTDASFDGVTGQTYIFSNGVLSNLWIGFVYDVNASGTVVGTTSSIEEGFESVVWTHEGGATEIPQLTGSLGINDSGLIVGTLTGSITPINAGTLVAWNNGVITELGTAPTTIGGNAPPAWNIAAVANDGRVLASLRVVPLHGLARYSMYLYDSEDGLRTAVDATHGLPSGLPFASTSGFGGSGDPSFGVFALDGGIFTYNSFISQIPDSSIATLRENSPVSTYFVGSVRCVAAVNQYNELIVFQYQGTEWSVKRITTILVPEGEHQVVMVADPTGVEPVVIVADGASLQLYRINPGATEGGHQLDFGDRQAIVRGLTTFTNAEGIVHLAGIAENGDVVIYYRDPSVFIAESNGWRYDNLTQVHLDSQELTTPVFVSGLTAFATPWSGMNIAGIDADGRVQTIWWSPESVFWKVSDLSDLAPVARFTGELSSYVSPWGTMHIVGVTAETNQVAALWWAPGFGSRWQANGLRNDAPAVAVDSIATFVTPWGAQNVLGRSDDGHVQVFWWAPQTFEWRVEELPSDEMPPTITGRVTASFDAVGDTATQTVFARGENGELLHMFWRNDGTPWMLENVTELI